MTRRPSALGADALDGTLAAAVLVIGIYEAVSAAPRGGIAPNVLAAAAFGVLVLRRRRWPAPWLAGGWCAVAVTQSAVLATTSQASVGWLAYVLIAFALGRHAAGRASVVSLGLIVAGMVAVYLVAPTFVSGDLFFPQAIGIGLWGAGRTLRGRARLTEQLHELAAQAQDASAHEAARAQAAERRRLAQEMHDVIAHSLSLVVVQAGGARRILATDPARAAEAAALIERTGRAALGEMRQLLGTLGTGLDQLPERRAAPSLADLDELVASAEAAGLTVTLTRTGEQHVLPAGVDLAAYRILQEALTNVLRHAGPVAARVSVARSPDGVELEVVNAPGRPGPAALDTAGHGLVGMRERAQLYRGDLEAIAIRGGGFRVTATLQAERVEALT